MHRGTSCDQAYEELFQYLDRELTDDELAIVRQHLDACPPCAHLFEFEGTVVRYVRERSIRVTCPAAVVSTIVTKFRARIAGRASH